MQVSEETEVEVKSLVRIEGYGVAATLVVDRHALHVQLINLAQCFQHRGEGLDCLDVTAQEGLGVLVSVLDA